MPEGNLHAYAVRAEANLEKLATGLAKAGADDNTVSAVSKMADVVRKIVEALGQGQEQTADDEAQASPESEEPAVREQQPEQPRRETMDSATADLHQKAQAKARANRGEDY